MVHQLDDLVGAQGDGGGRALFEGAGELGSEAGQAPKAGEHLLDRAGPEGSGTVPHVGGGYHQAGFVGILYEQLDHPGFADGVGGLAQPQAQPGSPGDSGAGGDPAGDGLLERSHLLRIERRREPRIGRAEGADPGFRDRAAPGPRCQQRDATLRKLRAHPPIDGDGEARGRGALGVDRLVDTARGDEGAVTGGGQRQPPRPGATVGVDGEPGHHPARADQRGGDRLHAILDISLDRSRDHRGAHRRHHASARAGERISEEARRGSSITSRRASDSFRS